MAKISYSQCSTKVIYLCCSKLRQMVVVGSAVWGSGSIILGQQEESLEIVRSHYGGSALRIGFYEGLRETGFCPDIPFEYPGKKTRLILLNIVRLLLLGGAPEKTFRAYPMMSKKLSLLTLSFWNKYDNFRFESTLLIHYSISVQVGLLLCNFDLLHHWLCPRPGLPLVSMHHPLNEHIVAS